VFLCATDLISDSLFLDAMAKDSSILSIDIKLDDSSYREWAFLVRTIVRVVGFDHLTNNPLDVKEDEAMRKIWRKSNAKVTCALILNVCPSLQMSLDNHSSEKKYGFT
jgi:hypothetical protein